MSRRGNLRWHGPEASSPCAEHEKLALEYILELGSDGFLLNYRFIPAPPSLFLSTYTYMDAGTMNINIDSIGSTADTSRRARADTADQSIPR